MGFSNELLQPQLQSMALWRGLELVCKLYTNAYRESSSKSVFFGGGKARQREKQRTGELGQIDLHQSGEVSSLSFSF